MYTNKKWKSNVHYIQSKRLGKYHYLYMGNFMSIQKQQF